MKNTTWFNWHPVFIIGSEGGSITLLGLKKEDGWYFKITTDEISFDNIFKDNEALWNLKSESVVLTGWSGALKLLEKYESWHYLYPIFAHPDFSWEIVNTLRDKKNESIDSEDSILWEEWRSAFHKTKNNQINPTLKSTSQIVGNIGMYYVCYQLSTLGWNVMPTARNARGVDIIAYDENSINYLGIQVKTLSGRNPVPLGNSLDKIISDYWVIVLLNGELPTTYILTPHEVKEFAHRGEKAGKISYWLQPKKYDQEFFKENWSRLQ